MAKVRAKAPHEKSLEEMNLTELVNYWTGYVAMEIGSGKSLRDTIITVVDSTLRVGHDRGRTNA